MSAAARLTPRTAPPGRAAELALIVTAFLLGVGVAVVVVQPQVAPQVQFDTAASVIHFERLVGGERLEAFVTTTPKPLLTVLDGLLHRLGGWAAVSWMAMVAHGLAVALGALLALRVGGWAAAAFVAVVLAGNGFLLVETAYAYGVPWAVALWCLAGLLLASDRPRWGGAGVALLLATLIRIETVAIVGVACLVLVLVHLRRRSRWWDATSMPRRAWLLVFMPALALPIMLVHDWLLTGDPMFWASVAARYSVSARIRGAVLGPVDVAASLGSLVVGQAAISLLAGIGVFVAVARRRWVGAAGVLGVGLGVAAFLILLSVRGTYVSGRYVAPIELATLFGAGLAVGAVVGWVSGRAGPRTLSTWRTAMRMVVAPVFVGAVLAIAMTMPWGPLDSETVARIERERHVQANATSVAVPISAVLDRLPDSRTMPPSPAGVTVPSNRAEALFVPGLLRPRMAVDLGLPLDRVSGFGTAELRSPGDIFVPGQVIYHDRWAGQTVKDYGILEADEPFEWGDLVLHPVISDPEAGYWVWETREE